MKAAKTWCIAALALVAGLSSASCGKDEVAGDGKGATGSIIPTGGSAGSGGGRSMAGTGASSGSGVGTPATKLGQGCVTDNECVDSNAPGLKCVTSKDTVLGDGAPPKGLCTAPCVSDDECAALGAGALCFPFGSGSDAGYCIESCSFGMPNLGEAKCHSRPEFNCYPALLGQTPSTCAATADCQAGEICLDGTCDVVFPGCLPGCRGDIDCDDGMYCDQSFLSGVCVKKKPSGKALGEPCTVPPASSPSEPDECLGFCQADEAKSDKGHCATTCGIGNECAWNATTEKFDGLCLYASVLTADTGDVGDFGFCTPSCNCTTDCDNPKLACSLLTQGALPTDASAGEAFRGAGLCFSPDPMTREYNQCAGSAGAGAGGAETGAAGSSVGGEAGAPTGSGGAAAGAGGAGGAP